MISVGTAHAATRDISGVVEVDLLFPRNDTCAPAPHVPIVFAIQNTELAPLLNLWIGFEVYNMTNGSILD